MFKSQTHNDILHDLDGALSLMQGQQREHPSRNMAIAITNVEDARFRINAEFFAKENTSKLKG